jgi:hypothetical protein
MDDGIHALLSVGGHRHHILVTLGLNRCHCASW